MDIKYVENKTYWVLGNFDRHSFVSDEGYKGDGLDIDTHGIGRCVEEAISFSSEEEAVRYLINLDEDYKDAFKTYEGEIEVLHVNEKTEVSKLNEV